MQARSSFSFFLLLVALVSGFKVTLPPTTQQQSCHRVLFPCPPSNQVAATASQGMRLHSSRTTTLDPLVSPQSSISRSSSTLENKKISYLQLPPYLANLDIGASIEIGGGSDDEDGRLKIIKLANDPPIFWVQNFLSREDCNTLMEGAAQHLVLQDAETRQGIVEHRVGSKVAWMGGDDDDDDDEENYLPSNLIAGYTQHLSANLFLPHAPQVEAERLQVVQYDQNGKYDIHHDGFNRTVTVLTYLNGVAGTWFPYVGASDADIPHQREVNSQVDLLSRKQPGLDGLCMVSSSSPNDNANDGFRATPGVGMLTSIQNNNVVQVRPGDAVVFYNYQDHPEHGHIMSWKSLHCGLPATREKWIATNWLRANDDDDDENS